MIVKIVKIYLALSLVLWTVWGHFQGGSLCLTSSVCWSLQCLISALSRGGQWWTLFFLGSLVQLRCGEGGTLQANNTGVCLQCLSLAGPAPAHGAHCSGSTLLCWELSEAGLGCMHLLGLSRSGSALSLTSEAQIELGLCFVPFPGPSSSGVWRVQSLQLIAFPVLAAQFSGCTTGAHCEVDGDCPEPPEVLVSKEACLHFGR